MYRNRVTGTGTVGGGSCRDPLPGGERGPWWALAALLCVLFSGASAPPHPFRLSVADVGVTGSVLDVRIRFFWDDLQLAVMESTSDMEFVLAETDEVDAVVEQYINDMLRIEAGSTVLQGTVLERGIRNARSPDEVMWWYRLEYPLDPTVDRIHVRNRVLFNMFEDQRNLVHIKTRTGRERTYYFGWDEDNVTLRLN